MTRLEYVAGRILGGLHDYDLKRCGNYSLFLAGIALEAMDEPIPADPEPAPATRDLLDELL